MGVGFRQPPAAWPRLWLLGPLKYGGTSVAGIGGHSFYFVNRRLISQYWLFLRLIPWQISINSHYLRYFDSLLMWRGSSALPPNRAIILIEVVIGNPLVVEDRAIFSWQSTLAEGVLL